MKIVTMTLPKGAADGSVLTSDVNGLASWEASAGGGGAYSTSFSNADLVAGILTVIHNLANKYVQVVIYDDVDSQIIPVAVTLVDENSLDIDMSSSVPLTGTWNVVVAVGSSGLTLGAGYLTPDGDGSQLTGVVHTTGVETVVGVKTFTDAIIPSGSGASSTRLGEGSLAGGAASLALGKGASTPFANSVAIGSGVVTTALGEVRLGAGISSGPGLAPGFYIDGTSSTLNRPIFGLVSAWDSSADNTRAPYTTMYLYDHAGPKTIATFHSNTGVGSTKGNIHLFGTGRSYEYGEGKGVLKVEPADYEPIGSPNMPGTLLWFDSLGALKQKAKDVPRMTTPGFIWIQKQEVNVTNTVVETVIGGNSKVGAGTCILPANFFRVGRMLRVRASGYYSTGANPGACSWRIRMSGADVGYSDTGLDANTSGANWSLEREFMCIGEGTGGTLWSGGWVTIEMGTTRTGRIEPWNLQGVNVNTSITLDLSLQFAFNVASSANTLSLLLFSLEVINPP